MSTVAPAWEADKRPVYGGFFWINGEGALAVPKEAYYMAGAGGQTTLIVPSHDRSFQRQHGRVGRLQEGTDAPDGGGAPAQVTDSERTTTGGV